MRTLAQFQVPAQTIIVTESTNSGTRINVDFAGAANRTYPPVQSGCSGPSATPIASPAPCTYAGSLFTGHSGMGNQLFADGHAKAYKPLATLNNADGTGTNLWDIEGLPFTGVTYTAVRGNLEFAQNTWK